MTRIALTVNGKRVEADVTPRTHLADFLREQLLLTGTHIGCEHGICGACTVEIEGEIARSCITYAVACDGARIRTIESFDDDALMVRLRQAFTEAHALQCGYCTPGMLIAARDLVRRKSGMSRAEIRTEMSGNLCRCTGYAGIVDAVERVMTENAMPVKAETHATFRSQDHAGVDPRLHGDDAVPSTANAGTWLGPAPGPVASVAPASAPAIASARTSTQTGATPVQTSPLSRARVSRAPIRVTVGELAEVGGETRIAQNFVLPHGRDAVWELMSDVERLAHCMPGLVLDGPPQGDKVSGRLEAKIGPIAASFAGEGTVRQIADEYRQVIEGRGGDRRSGSRASGRVDYRLSSQTGEAGSEATRVDVVISYALAGPLAQIGRSGLVRDLVRRIGETFAQNLDAQLTDPAAEMAQAQIGGLSLLVQVLAGRVREWLARVFPRRQ
jgi:aerobic carbon-monoxide dehydrogenase small subunit